MKKNPRLSNSEIAVMLGKSEEETEEQIRLYEKSGIIKGYRAMIDKNKAIPKRLLRLLKSEFSLNSVTDLMKLQTELQLWKKLKAFIL